jgi:hypothetical protein
MKVAKLMNILKIQSIISVFIILFIVFSTIAYPSSVYVITDHRDSDISAYKITGDQINYQIQMDPPLHFGFGAVGLALDPCSSTLFTSYDDAYKIGIINAKILETIKSIDIPVDFAGLVFDTKNQRLLSAQRENNKLYVYLWNPNTKTLTLEEGTPKTLTNLAHPFAHGITIDEVDRILYVTDTTNAVKYYDADDPNFGYLGSINITVSGNDRPAVGIDFYRDQQGNKFLYTGAWSHSVTHNYLVRTDISDANNPVSVERLIGASATGISVCQYTGYVYVTTSNNHIEVYNNAIFPSDPCDTETSDIDGPADIIVSGDVLYKPPAFYFEKVDVNEPNCVLPGDYITYRITYGPNEK